MNESAPILGEDNQIDAHPRSLLVIEDDLSLIQLIDLMLDDVKPGIEWEYVTSGEEALDLIRRRGEQLGRAPFSLVMTDIFLEGDVTGFDVWQESQSLFPKMPFVVTSGLSSDRYFSVLRAANNRPVFLPKPLTRQGCQAILREYLT